MPVFAWQHMSSIEKNCTDMLFVRYALRSIAGGGIQREFAGKQYTQMYKLLDSASGPRFVTECVFVRANKSFPFGAS